MWRPANSEKVSLLHLYLVIVYELDYSVISYYTRYSRVKGYIAGFENINT